jgi:RecA-family ATPase
MSITGKIIDDIDPANQFDDDDDDVEEARPNGKAKERIRRHALYMASREGGELGDWIKELTPSGKPFSDDFLLQTGYEPTDLYDYTSTEGYVLYQSICYRHRLVKGEKRFLIRRPATLHDQRRTDWRYVNGWVFGQTVRVIYRWHEVARRPDERVIVCEGEKNAERLLKLGLLATTVASQKWSENAAEALSGRDVSVLEDNDEAGRRNAANAVAMLRSVAKSVRIVRLPGLGHREDVEDWLDAGRTKEELVAACDASVIEGLVEIDIVGMKGKEVPIQQYAIEDRVPLGYVTLFSGHGAAGKSLLMLQCSVAAVLSKPWLGLAVRPGPVMFVDAEDGERPIHKRLADILRHYGADFDQLGDLHAISLVAKDAVLAVADRNGRMMPTALYSQLLQRAREIRPGLIVLASSADMFAGNEIDRTQVRQFVSLLGHIAATVDCAVVLISHPSVAGMESDSGISGSTAWHNSVRARIYLKGADKKKQQSGEEPTGRRVMEFRKNQYGPETDSIVLRYQDGLFVPILNTNADQAERETEAENVYLEILGLLLGQGRDLSANKSSRESYAAAMIYKHRNGRFFVSQSEAEDAEQRLLDANRIHIVETGPLSKRRKRILAGPGATAEATEEHPL